MRCKCINYFYYQHIYFDIQKTKTKTVGININFRHMNDHMTQPNDIPKTTIYFRHNVSIQIIKVPALINYSVLQMYITYIE